MSGAAMVAKPKPAERIVISGSGSIERTIKGTTIASRGRRRNAYPLPSPPAKGEGVKLRDKGEGTDAEGEGERLRHKGEGSLGVSALATFAVIPLLGVVVAAGVAGDFVHHDADQPGLSLLQQLERPGVVGTLRAGPQDVEDAVGYLGQLDGIGVERAGRGVDQHHVRVIAEIDDHLAHRREAQELGRIWRQRPSRNEDEVVEATEGLPDLQPGRAGADHVRKPERGSDLLLAPEALDAAPALAIGLEHLVETWTAKVGVDEDHPLAGARHQNREVDGGRRLAFTGLSTGDQERTDAERDGVEIDVGAQRPVGLGERRAQHAVADHRHRVARHQEPFTARSDREVARGMAPRTGAPRNSSACSGRLIVRPKYSSSMTKPIPIARPRNPA